jgi:hypothetical protein
VLLTAFLPANTPLPATITIPIPAGADVNAVARVTSEGELFADITFDDSTNGQLTLTTPDPRFRVEYYIPYTLEGSQRTFSYEWQADMVVGELQVSVHQPVASTDLSTVPESFSVTPRRDGLQYHNLSPQPISAGELFSVQVSYSRTISELSAELLQPAETAETTNSAAEVIEPAGQPATWQVILLASGGAALLAVGGWMLFGERLLAARRSPVKSRPAPRPARPKRAEIQAAGTTTPAPANAQTAQPVQFCHQCGQHAAPDDRFCRSCGTRLKVLDGPAGSTTVTE